MLDGTNPLFTGSDSVTTNSTDPTPAPKPPDIAAGLKRWIGERDHPHAVYAARDVDALVSRCETAERELSLARLRWGYEELKRERDEARAEVERLRAYVGGQMLRSDFRTADEMRAALDAALVKVEQLRAEVERVRFIT